MGRYYIAYCYGEGGEGRNAIGYGNMVIQNEKGLDTNTLEGIQTAKEFIKEKTLEKTGHEITNVIIMDYRKLEE